MFLICNSGAIRTDQYADLSQTDCMMLCFGPNTSAHQRSINHQPLLLSGPDIRKISSPVDFYHGTRSTLYVLMLFSFFSPSVFFLNTHTHTHVQKTETIWQNLLKRKEMSELKLATDWSSANEGLWPLPRGLYTWILYISVQCRGTNRNPTWNWEMSFTFQLMLQLTKQFAIHFLKPVRLKWDWPHAQYQSPCYWPVHIKLRLWINRPFRESINNRLKLGAILP